MKLSRKEFLRGALAAAGGAVGLGATSTGCGGDDAAAPGGGGGCGATIGSNHKHSMSVSQADVDAAQPKTYSIQGGATHNHEVSLTAAHFADLKAGKSVFVTSTTTAAHEHDIDVKCG
jgi:hypothetical protein